MNDLMNTIWQYRESCAALRTRVGELSVRISGKKPLLPDESVQNLQKRRYLLYTELADMESAIRQMEEYTQRT